MPWGNNLGKSHWLGRLILWFTCTRPGSLVVTTSPTFEQLAEVLWKNIRQANERSTIPLGLKLTAKPLRAKMAEGWGILGIATSKTERMSGHHNPDLLAVVDEASDVARAIKEAIDSLGPSKFVAIGNPLRADGWFRELARTAEKQRNDPSIPDSERVVMLRVPSTASPHATWDHSPYGMACGSWLRRMAREYGRNSLWWKTHIDALFPDANHDGLFLPGWLDNAAAPRPPRTYGGYPRIACDLAKGVGCDRTVVLVRDDAGILELVGDNSWGLEEAATQISILRLKYGIPDHRISFDGGGHLGQDFPNYLARHRIINAVPYYGATPLKEKFTNLRSLAAWRMRQRLNPEWEIDGAPSPTTGVVNRADRSTQQPYWFNVVAGVDDGEGATWWPQLREELLAHDYEMVGTKIKLRTKDEIKAKLGRSPDLADVMFQSYAFED